MCAPDSGVGDGVCTVMWGDADFVVDADEICRTVVGESDVVADLASAISLTGEGDFF